MCREGCARFGQRHAHVEGEEEEEEQEEEGGVMSRLVGLFGWPRRDPLPIVR